jgi:hypothetical protein
MKTVTAKGTSGANAVIASASEAIHGSEEAWIASSLALLAMTKPNRWDPDDSGLIDVDASAMVEL